MSQMFISPYSSLILSSVTISDRARVNSSVCMMSNLVPYVLRLRYGQVVGNDYKNRPGLSGDSAYRNHFQLARVPRPSFAWAGLLGWMLPYG
jgi:hypothetical protein